jgi:hypothetical protein
MEPPGTNILRFNNVEAKPYIPMCAISMQSSADDRWEVACSGACWRGAIIRAMM